MASKLAIAPARLCLRAARVQPKFRTTKIIRLGNMRSFSSGISFQAKKYSQDHEWVELSPDKKTATVGITEYAANALGDVVYVELPELSLDVSAGDSMGAVESVKSASDIMAPISGTIIERNELLEEKPKLLNQDPEGEAWFVKIEVSESAEAELSELLDEAGYKSFTEESTQGGN